MLLRSFLCALLVVALTAGTALADETYGSDELDRPLSTWVAGQNEAPDSKVDATQEPENPPGDGPPFLGEELSGSKMVFVLDRSCSMNWGVMAFSPVYDSNGGLVSNPNRWQVVQSETANAISALDPDTDMFEIILYSSSYMVWRNSLVVPVESEKADGISYIYGIHAQGGTRFHGPLNHAFTHSGYQEADTIIFMTDGFPFDGSQVQSSWNGWMGSKNSEFYFQGFQIGGGSLNSIMAWIDAQPQAAVELK